MSRRGVTRRSLLSLVPCGVAAFAGCSGDETPTEPALDTDGVTTPVKNPLTSGPGSTTLDTTAPEVNVISVSLDDPQTTENRAIAVTVDVEDIDERVTISVNDGRHVLDLQTVAPDADELILHGEISGGGAYEFTISAVDESGNEATETVPAGYVPRPTTPVESDRLIGIHYYAWWGRGTHWENGYDGIPVLGEYNSRDSNVIEQHLDWLGRAGINWLSFSWWGRDSWSDETIGNYLLKSAAIEDFEFSILYETQKLLDQGSNGWRTDFDSRANREQFISDIEYLADAYFSRDNYLHFDGRPVLYLYTSSGFEGDFNRARREAERRIDQELYFVGDFPFQEWTPAKATDLDFFDGLSNYSAFYEPWDDINDVVPGQPRHKYTEWLLRAKSTGIDFIPTLSRGFDKTSHYQQSSKELPILEGSPQSFASWCEATRGSIDPDRSAVLVTSFNEWHEGTQFEPGREYGTGYLDVVKSHVSSADYRHRNLDAIARIVLRPGRTIAEHEVNPDSTEERSRDLAFTIASFELENAESGWAKRYDISPGVNSPYFIEGVFSYNPRWERRWCGGSNKRVIFGVPWSDVRKATDLRISCAPQYELGDLAVVGGLMNGTSSARTFVRGQLEEYLFPLRI